MDTPLEHAMTQQALVRGELRVRTAAGTDVLVPAGALEIEFGEGLAKLRWRDAQGREQEARIDPDDYERHVVAGRIRPSVN